MSRRDVELVIRAKDDASKQADKIAKSLDALDQIQKELANSSGKTGSEIDQLASRIGKLSASDKAASSFQKIQQAIESSTVSLNKQQREYAEASAQIDSYEKQIASATAVLNRLNRQASGEFGPVNPQIKGEIKLVERSLKSLQNGLKRSTTEAERMDAGVKDTQNALRQLDGVADEAGKSIQKLAKQEAELTAEAKKARDAAEGNAKAAKAEAQSQAQLEAALIRLDAARKASVVSGEGAVEAARRAKQEYLENRNQLHALQQQMKASAQPTAALTKAVEAQRRATLESKRTWTETTAAVRQNVVQTGSALGPTNALANAQNRLDSEARGAGRAQRDLGRGTRDAADAAERSTRSWGRVLGQLRLIQKESRQSLSIMQRIRGQVLSIGAGYIGVFGAQRAVGSIIQAGMDQEAINARFLVAFAGDQAKANEEMEFAKQIARDLALSYRSLAPEYANLAIAARGTALEGEGARQILIGMSQASRANKLSADQTARAFKALTQIMSKGKFTAEEVRQQLGDQIPGAFRILADAIKVPAEELDKLMENGQIRLDAMLSLMFEMSRRAQGGLAPAMDSLSAATGRFDNSLFDLQVRVAQSGFLDELSDSLNEAAEAMKDPAVQQGAVQLGRALGDLIVAFVKAAKHTDEWLAALKLLAYWMGLRFAAGLANDLVRVVGALGSGIVKLRKYALALGITTAALTGFSLVAGGLIALFAAWKLYQWAYDNFMPFRRLSIFTFSSLMKLFDQVKLAWAKVATFFASALKSPFETITAYYGKLVSKIIGLASKLNKVLGNDTIAQMLKGLQGYADGLTIELGAEWDKEYERRKKEIEADAAKREDILTGMMAETFGGADPNPAGGLGSPSGGQGTDLLPTPPPWTPGGAEEDAKKAADTLARSVGDTIANLRQRLAELMGRDASLTLEQQLDANLAAIKSKYAEIYDDLKTLGLGRQSEEWRVVDALVAQESLIARQKYEQEKLKQAVEKRQEAEQRINTLQQLRRDLIQNAEFARDNGEFTQYEQTRVKVNEVTAALRQAIEAQIAYWQSAGNSEQAQAAIAALEAQKNALIELSEIGKITATDIGEVGGAALNSGFDTFANSIRETGNVLQGLRDGFLQFAQEFLFEIGKMIAKQAILNALQNSSFGGSSIGQAFIGAFANHSGGMAGAGTPRLANPSWFSNATRYHSGGIAGLKPNEVPTILEKGEEVLTRNDPRHALNGGNGNGGKGPMQFNQYIALDPEDLANSVAGAPSFSRNIMTVLRAERRQLSTILEGG